MNKNEPESTKLSGKVKLLGWIAFLFIIFSFIAPYLFTGESSYDRYNFTQTGPIGDTIGGLMNPFIAIAGVIMTFLAFLMQVRANEIQRKQFLETLQKEEEQEKTDSFYNLQILKLDIENIIDNIKTNINSIDEFLTTIEDDPYKTCILSQTPLQQYERVKQIPRKLVFRGFDLYVSPIDSEWTSKFSDLYNILDFASGCLKNLYQIVEVHNNEVYNIKIKQKEKLIKLEDKCCDILNSPAGTYDDRFLTATRNLLEGYRKETTKETKDDGDFGYIVQTLIKFNEKTEQYYPNNGKYDKERELFYYTHNIIIEINNIMQSSNQITHEVKKIRRTLYNKLIRQDSKLMVLHKILDKSIKKSELHISK